MKILHNCIIFFILISLLTMTIYATDTTKNNIETISQCPYIDVVGHWSEDYVNFVSHYNYIDGITETEFQPDSPMTREMFIIALARMMQITADPVDWAVNVNLLRGYGDGNLGLKDTVTREQMTIFFERFLDLCDKDISLYKSQEISKFSDDESISSWAKNSVYNMQGVHLIKGKDNNVFDPLGLTSRGEGATVISNLWRLLNLVTADDLFAKANITDIQKYHNVNINKYINDNDITIQLLNMFSSKEVKGLLDRISRTAGYRIFEVPEPAISLPENYCDGLKAVYIEINHDAKKRIITLDISNKQAKWSYGYLEGAPENNVSEIVLSDNDINYITTQLQATDLTDKEISYIGDSSYVPYSYTLHLEYEDGYVLYKVSNTNTDGAGEIISLCDDLFENIFSE